MTLVTATNFGAGFAIMTSDIREVIRGYWRDLHTNEYTLDNEDDYRISEEKAVKVQYLSNYALIGVGGIAEICRYISERITPLVEESDDLAECGVKLAQLIKEIREGEDAPSFATFLDKENGIQIIINGFTYGGAGGLVVYESGPDAEVQSLPTPEQGIRWSLIPPDKIYNEWGNSLIEDVGDAETALNRAITLHARVAVEQTVKVSPECMYFVLFMDETGQLSKLEGEFDTSLWFEQLQK